MFFRKIIRKYQYFKKFKTYDEALKVSNEYIDQYYEGNKKLDLILPENVPEWERTSILPIITPFIKKKTVILDYGGGHRPIFSEIKKSTDLFIKTIVIERENYCSYIKKKIPIKYKKYLRYYPSLNSIKKKNKIDVVCFNSSIQYLKEYKYLIKKCKKFNPKYILITRSNFHNEKKDFFSLETIVKNHYHPHIFFSYKSFLNFMKKMKYKLIFKNEYNRNRYQHELISGKRFCHMDLIFSKK